MYDRNIKNILMNQVVCLSVSNIPKTIRFCICLVCLLVFAGDSGKGFRDKYVQQLAVTLEILFDQMLKHIPACRSGVSLNLYYKICLCDPRS